MQNQEIPIEKCSLLIDTINTLVNDHGLSEVLGCIFTATRVRINRYRLNPPNTADLASLGRYFNEYDVLVIGSHLIEDVWHRVERETSMRIEQSQLNKR